MTDSPPAPPSAVTAPLLEALMAACELITDALRGFPGESSAAAWQEAAGRWRETFHSLLAGYLHDAVAEPLADEAATVALMTALPMPRALAELLAEIFTRDMAARDEARTAWMRWGEQADATAKLHEELEAFRAIADGKVTVDRGRLKALLIGFECAVHRGAVPLFAPIAADVLWEDLGGRDG